jgi:glycosyltransferase involved in cell wall biosynthesis
MGLTVVYYRIHDLEYPRNQRVREHLRSVAGATVRELVRPAPTSRIGRLLAETRSLWKAARGADAIVLSEFALTHAPLVWAVGRLRGATVVIDGFIGLHETAIGDWQTASPRSLKATRFRVQDWLAVRLADLYLIDTEMRAQRIRDAYGRRANVLSLPVGAPEWARWTPPVDPDVPLRILYYGNYIPLHGVDQLLTGLSQIRDRPILVTMVGESEKRPSYIDMVKALGLTDVVTFVDRVSTEELAQLIDAHHVVAGVFGSSTKARTVIANKVWQGIACGRVVITQGADAVREITEIAGDYLIPTTPGSPESIADAFQKLSLSEVRRNPNVSDELESYVRGRFAQLGPRITAARIRRRKRRTEEHVAT